jgi:uncharacterized protein
MGIEQLRREKRNQIIRIAAKHGAHNVRVFGSVARGDEGADSDVDFLVELEKGKSVLDQAGLLIDLEKLLGCHVDVVTDRGLRSRIRERVLKEAISL